MSRDAAPQTMDAVAMDTAQLAVGGHPLKFMHHAGVISAPIHAGNHAYTRPAASSVNIIMQGGVTQEVHIPRPAPYMPFVRVPSTGPEQSPAHSSQRFCSVQSHAISLSQPSSPTPLNHQHQQYAREATQRHSMSPISRGPPQASHTFSWPTTPNAGQGWVNSPSQAAVDPQRPHAITSRTSTENGSVDRPSPILAVAARGYQPASKLQQLEEQLRRRQKLVYTPVTSRQRATSELHVFKSSSFPGHPGIQQAAANAVAAVASPISHPSLSVHAVSAGGWAVATPTRPSSTGMWQPTAVQSSSSTSPGARLSFAPLSAELSSGPPGVLLGSATMQVLQQAALAPLEPSAEAVKRVASPSQSPGQRSPAPRSPLKHAASPARGSGSDFGSPQSSTVVEMPKAMPAGLQEFGAMRVPIFGNPLRPTSSLDRRMAEQ